MRFSEHAQLKIQTPVGKGSGNRVFFERVLQKLDEDALRCAILLVGGSDFRALTVRRAQSLLRFDRTPSHWSHAGIIVKPKRDTSARGLEVTLWPRDAKAQAPADNGVTAFALRDYADEARYPNLALLCFTDAPMAKNAADKKKQAALPDAAAIKARMLKALENPNVDRVRFPLWDQLAPWAAYAYGPDGTPNPLTQGTPLPSAALCELAFEGAGIDITPGATSSNVCPEHLWATFKYWGSRLAAAAGLRLTAYAVVRDDRSE
jgi:hypothetical protein